MKRFVWLFSILLSLHTSGQNHNCIREDINRIKVPAYLKDLPIAETQSVSIDYFKNGVELKSANPAAKIVGYRVVRECPSSDFMTFDVCGAKMDSTTFKKFFASLNYPDKVVHYSFDLINMEVSGQRFLMPSFGIVLVRSIP